MPDPFDKELESLLAYPEENSREDLFVVDVMRQVRAERKRRRVILWLFGGVGAVFGILGASMLSDTIGQWFTGAVSITFWMQLPLFAAGAAAFYAWFMNDDLLLKP